MSPTRSATSVMLFLLAGAAWAGEPARPLDRASLWIGGVQAHSDTTVTARAHLGDYSASGQVSLEDDLDMDQRQPVGHARLDLLVGDAQGFSLEYFGFERGNSVELSRQIDFDGQTYLARARVEGSFRYDFGSAAWRWWLGQGRTVVGLGLGIAWYGVETRLAGEASLNGDSVHAETGSSDSALAPLVALGWRHAFNDRWRAYADLSGVARGGGQLSGHIVDAAVGLEWFPFERVGFAVEYGLLRLRLDRPRDYLDTRLDLELRGPSIFLRLR